MFIAVQLGRTREFRDVLQEMGDIIAKSSMSGLFRDEEAIVVPHGPVTPEMLDQVRVVPSASNVFGLGLQVAMEEIVPRLLRMSWHLLRSERRVLLTSDHPVAYWQYDPKPHRGVGVGNADEVSIALDPRQALVLTPHGTLPEGVSPLPRSAAREMNRQVALRCYEWVFHDPRHNPLNGIDVPRKRALFLINNRPVYRGTGWGVFKQVLPLDPSGPPETPMASAQ